MRWLSYVPATANDLKPGLLAPADPVDRPVTARPPADGSPYDVRELLDNADGTGLFDKGSFTETLAGWGKTVVAGRAKLGGIPFGVISVETRTVEAVVPADPANPDSRESIKPQAGQVWYPDSAHKTAQAIADFGRGEKLPLMILANWRGFSGGTRDMYDEVLKFGAKIVDELTKYDMPVCSGVLVILSSQRRRRGPDAVAAPRHPRERHTTATPSTRPRESLRISRMYIHAGLCVHPAQGRAAGRRLGRRRPHHQ